MDFVVGVLLLLLSNEINGKERQLRVNQRSEACPNGIVYREGCKLCYCVEEFTGYVIHKCESKFTRSECGIVGQWAHCDEESLLYNYDRECEGPCECNAEQNLTVCQNLPCYNAVLTLFGFYNLSGSDSVNVSTKSIDDNAVPEEHVEEIGEEKSSFSTKFPFHGRRIRRHDDGSESTTASESATEPDSKTIESSTEESDSSTAEGSTAAEDSTTAEGSTKAADSATAEGSTEALDSATAEGSTKASDSSTAEGSISDDDSTAIETKAHATSELKIGDEKTSSVNDDEEDCDERRTTKTKKARFNQANKETVECDSSDPDCEYKPPVIVWTDDLNPLGEREMFTNVITKDCPYGNFYRQGCRICYCFPKAERIIPSNYCVDLVSRPSCTYWADKVHCEDTKLLFNYTKQCEGSCKCFRNKNPHKTYTTCRYLPCSNEILERYNRYETAHFRRGLHPFHTETRPVYTTEREEWSTTRGDTKKYQPTNTRAPTTL